MEWINLDYVAYGVLGLTWLFLFTPCLGAGLNGNSFTGYWLDMKNGLAAQTALAIIVIVVFSVVWSVNRFLP